MKKRITIRIDEDIIGWFRSKGKGYQTLINDALRHHINHEASIKTPVTFMDMDNAFDKVRQDTIPKLKEQMAAMQDDQAWRSQVKAMPKKGKK